MVSILPTRRTRARDASMLARECWLASLGAAALATTWARNDARRFVSPLVREGAGIEARTLRAIGSRMQRSVDRANRLIDRTRSTVVTTAATLARTAAGAAPRVHVSVAAGRAPAPRAKAPKRASAKRAHATERGVRKTRKTRAR